MKIIFMGTPEEGAKILECLASNKKQVILVVTQPDRPKGRGLKVAFSPVKEIALKYNLPLEQPESAKDSTFIKLIGSLKPDLIVVAAYGKILPKALLDAPKYGCINLHASLLPKYRGAAPMQWALLNGEKETGMTIFKLEELLDTGPIIIQEKIEISDDDNVESLSKKLFDLGAKLLLKVIEQIEKGEAKYIPQKETDVTYAPSITKESGAIDFKKTAREIHNRIRAMYLKPGAYTFYSGRRLKIISSKIQSEEALQKKVAPGEIIEIIKNIGFVVAAGKGSLLIKEVQPEAGKKMGAFEFVIGHKIKPGEVFPS